MIRASGALVRTASTSADAASTGVARALRSLEPPLYATWVTGGILTTQGGLRVDTCGRVLRHDGSVVRGLYAGGGSAAGVSGPSADGYSSGNGLLCAFGFGWIIGEHVGHVL